MRSGAMDILNSTQHAQRNSACLNNEHCALLLRPSSWLAASPHSRGVIGRGDPPRRRPCAGSSRPDRCCVASAYHPRAPPFEVAHERQAVAAERAIGRHGVARRDYDPARGLQLAARRHADV